MFSTVPAWAQVNISKNKNTVTIENQYLARTFSIANGILRTQTIENKRTDGSVTVYKPEQGSEEFVINTLGQPIAPKISERKGWTATASSWCNDGPKSGKAEFIVDGDLQTLWHTNYRDDGTGSKDFPFWFNIDMKKNTSFRSFAYVPRQGAENGRIKGFELYVANSEKDLDKPENLVRLDLPATPDELADALNACGAVSWSEAVFEARDSAIPHILEELDCDGMDDLNELAQAIQYRQERSELPKLKAVLHAADCHNISTATFIAENLDDYLYEKEPRSVEEVGLDELRFIVDSEALKILQKHVDLYNYGNAVMEEHHSKLTPYGLVERKDGEMQMFFDEKPQGMVMQ